MGTRVATYTRISTDEDHQPYSLEAQQQRLAAYVESQGGWEVVRSFTDQMSGSTLDRPDLKRLLLEARAGRFDLLLVYRVDRLSRSVRGLAQVLDELSQAGVVFRSATEPFDTGSPAGRMMVQMLGVFAEFERATIIDRVIAGMERKAARGGWNGGERPFGYMVDAESGGLVEHPAEAAIVPMIFDCYVRRRLGAHAIAKSLNRMGQPSKSGGRFNANSILTILRIPVYTGRIHFRGSYYPGRHPQLVGEETFEAVQKLLAERCQDRAGRPAISSEYILGGLVRCCRCGHHLVGTSARGNRYSYRYYTCYGRQRHGLTVCDADRLPAEELDKLVLGALADTYSNPRLLRAAIDSAHQTASSERPARVKELEALSSKHRASEEALNRYFEAFESGSMSEATCAPRIEALTKEIRRLKGRAEDLEAKLERTESPEIDDEALASVGARIREITTTGTLTERKALAQSLVSEVTALGRDEVQPYFRLPLGVVLRQMRPGWSEIDVRREIRLGGQLRSARSEIEA